MKHPASSPQPASEAKTEPWQRALIAAAYLLGAVLLLGGIVCLIIGWSRDQADGALMAQAVEVTAVVTGKDALGTPGLYNRRAVRLSTMKYVLETTHGNFPVSQDEYDRYQEGGGLKLWKLPTGEYISHRPNGSLPWILIGMPWALGATIGTWKELMVQEKHWMLRVFDGLFMGCVWGGGGLFAGIILWFLFA